jgi:hypothetical protein
MERFAKAAAGGGGGIPAKMAGSGTTIFSGGIAKKAGAEGAFVPNKVAVPAKTSDDPVMGGGA